MSPFKQHLEHCDPETLVMLCAIEDMAKASAQLFTGRESEERIQQRIKGCQAHIVNEEVQAAYEKEVLKPLHALFFFHETRAIFNSHGRVAKTEKGEEVTVEADGKESRAEDLPTSRSTDILDQYSEPTTKGANTSIPDIVVTAPYEDKQEDLEELETEEMKEDVATDFTDPTNPLTTIPKKGGQDRLKLWTNMEVNEGVLQKVDMDGKDGLFYKSLPGISKLPFEVSFKESSIRPVVTMQFHDEQSVKKARTLINSEISGQYLTQPPMPVMVLVKFSKNTKGAKVDAELAPATIGQIAKAAILLHATQKKFWEDGAKSWKWEAMKVPKKELKGELKEIMGLMKSNPVFVRVAQPVPGSDTAVMTTDSKARDAGRIKKEAHEGDQVDGNKDTKGDKVGKKVEDHTPEATEQVRGGGIGSFVGGFVRKVLG